MSRTPLATQGDFSIFVEQPISLTKQVATVVLLELMILRSFRTTREEAFKEEEV